MSLLELLARFAELDLAVPPVRFADWRPGDQRYYVSDTSKFERLAGWRARTGVTEGLRGLHRWLVAAVGVRTKPFPRSGRRCPEAPVGLQPEIRTVPA